MRYRRPVLLCALLLVAFTVGAVPVSAQPAAEETTFEVQLQDDGDARWTIIIGVPLEDRTELEEFRDFGESFESSEEDFPVGVETFELAAAEASDATGREMSIERGERQAVVVNDTVDGENQTGYGEFRVSFTWTSFARIGDNGTMYVGDAFNTTDGTWLPGLEPNQNLIIRSPPGYGSPTTSPIGATGGDLRWEGPQTFEPGYFEIEYQPQANGPTPGTDVSTTLLIGALVSSIAALLLGLYLLWRRDSGETAESGAEPEAPEPEPEGEATGQPESTPTAEPNTEEEPDLDLLSDEERVEYLLEQNGGRMKQANIVKETGWSNAKVSQLLSSMEEEGRIDKLRIGRENLISLPDEGLGEIADEDE